MTFYSRWFVCAALLAAACGGDDDDNKGGPPAASDNLIADRQRLTNEISPQACSCPMVQGLVGASNVAECTPKLSISNEQVTCARGVYDANVATLRPYAQCVLGLTEASRTCVEQAVAASDCTRVLAECLAQAATGRGDCENGSTQVATAFEDCLK